MSINKDIFLHESDKAALDALESLPGFAQVTKAFIKAFNEKMLDVQNMSTNIRITDKQLKKYHDMLIPICKKLDIEVPDLYLTLNVMPNAYTSGDDKPCIVLTSGLLETMPEELIPTVLAHECGHIACHHVLYRTMGQMIFNGSLMLLMGGGLAALLTIPLRSAFAYWMRCSEFSADRAAILCDGSADKLVEMCMRFAGYDKRIADFADPKEFLNQAREYRDIIKDDSSRRSMEFALFRNNSHPNNALRALEADEWAKSEEFSRAKDYMDSLEAGISP
ncbi:MAG: M48 family metallopeptidase, partial [Erysipelotrichaceae bacterium]|nr:M48 family metallopeptidase [Erysipelotrichaceae bacterium]